MPLLDELLVGLGFEYDPKEAKQFNEDIGKTVNIVKQLTRIAVIAATAITGLAVSSAIASDEQGKLANEIGETVDNIDALQFALRKSGGTADGMTNSLRQLSKLVGETARGVGSGVEAFGLLGISVQDTQGNLKSSSDILLEISQRFKGLSKSQQIDLADKLGVSDSLRLLQRGPDAIRALTDEARLLGTTTEEDAIIAREFQESLTDLWQIMKDVGRTIAKFLIPAMKETNAQFADWWKTNRDIIKLKLPEWIDKFTMVLKLLTIAVGAFLAFRLVGHLATLIAMFKGLTVATLAANAAAFLFPLLIAALAVAFVALVEDAKVFFEGGESFIGDMLEKYPQWTNELRIVASVFATIAKLTGMIVDGWNQIFDLDFGKFFKDLPDFLTGVFGGQTEADIINSQLLQSTLIAPRGANSSTNIDRLEINVNGAGDPQLVANEVLNVFQQTSQDLNTVVDL